MHGLSPNLPFFSDAQIEEMLDLDALVARVEASLVALSGGETDQPVRTVVPLNQAGSMMFVMPACWKIAGLKLVTLAPGNARLNLPTHSSLILAVDADSALPLALLEANYITMMRTAAASVVASKYLAAESGGRLALLGSGVQAEGHLRLLRRAFDIREVAVWSPNSDRREAFAEMHGCDALPTAEAAVEGADIVVTATAARLPILKGAWLKPGAHVNAVGAPRPDWRELDDQAMSGVVVVDSTVAAMQEAGDVIGSGCTIAAEVGQLASRDVSAWRRQLSVFKSLGQAVEDMAAASLVLEAAGMRAA